MFSLSLTWLRKLRSICSTCSRICGPFHSEYRRVFPVLCVHIHYPAPLRWKIQFGQLFLQLGQPYLCECDISRRRWQGMREWRWPSMPRRYYARLSSDEFRIKLEKIRNSTENVKFKIQIRGRIWPQSSNSTKVDGSKLIKQFKFGLKRCQKGLKRIFLTLKML